MTDNILTKFHIEGLDIKTWMVRIKKTNSTPLPKNKTKQLLSPYAYIALVTQRELKIVNDTLWELINSLILLNI